MTQTLLPADFTRQWKALLKRISRIERTQLQSETILGDITGLTSAQIDALFEDVPPNGTKATALEGVNVIELVRVGDKWNKSAGYTGIV